MYLILYVFYKCHTAHHRKKPFFEKIMPSSFDFKSVSNKCCQLKNTSKITEINKNTVITRKLISCGFFSLLLFGLLDLSIQGQQSTCTEF